MSELRRLDLDQDLTIYHAAEVKERLMKALAEHEHLELDLSRVAEVDTAGVQILLLFKREAQRLGRTARIVGHSAAVLETIDFLHLAARLGDPMVVPADRKA